MPDLHAVVTMLSEPSRSLVLELWDDFGRACGLSGIRHSVGPHFTWHLAESYALERLGPELAAVAANLAPFRVRLAGAGLFTGLTPVVVLTIARSTELHEAHRRIAGIAMARAVNPAAYYSPAAWAPHITLAYGDVTAEKAACALGRLAERWLNWEILVEGFAVGQFLEGQSPKLIQHYPFGGAL